MNYVNVIGERDLSKKCHTDVCVSFMYCAAYRIKYNQLEFTHSLKHTLFPFHCHHHPE